MHAPGARVGLQFGHLGKASTRASRPVNSSWRRLDIRKSRSPEAAALVGIGDDLALPHDLFQQHAFRSLPQGDAFPDPAVQLAEVVLHFAEVPEQFPAIWMNCWNRSLTPVSSRTGRSPPAPGDFRVEFVSPLVQLLEPLGGVGLAALGHLPEQGDQCEQPGFVPTKLRSVRVPSQAIAFSVAGVRSNWASSEPWP